MVDGVTMKLFAPLSPFAVHAFNECSTRERSEKSAVDKSSVNICDCPSVINQRNGMSTTKYNKSVNEVGVRRPRRGKENYYWNMNKNNVPEGYRLIIRLGPVLLSSHFIGRLQRNKKQQNSFHVTNGHMANAVDAIQNCFGNSGSHKHLEILCSLSGV